MDSERVILLADCDCFFVSCERLDQPALNDKPVVVVTSVSNRGIIVSRSNEAKKLGLRVGQPVFQFHSQFPEVICVASRLKRYQEISTEVMQVLRRFTPDVEPVSIDEAYLDITGFDRLEGCHYTDYAQLIRYTVQEEVGVPISIGIGSSKTLAKLASDKAKHSGGLFVISKEDRPYILNETRLEEICGIGKRLLPQYHKKGIWSVADMMEKPPQWMLAAFGVNGERLRLELDGICVSAVSQKEEPPQSIQISRSFDLFTRNFDFLKGCLPEHVHEASKKMRRWNGFCGCLSVMLRTKEFKTIEWESFLPGPTNSEMTLIKEAEILLKNVYQEANRRYPNAVFRAVGITLKKLTFDKQIQYALFHQVTTEDDPLSHAIDALEEKFGEHIVKFGK